VRAPLRRWLASGRSGPARGQGLLEGAADAAPDEGVSPRGARAALLSGTATVWAGDERYELTEGGVAYLCRDVPHTYRSTSPKAELLTLCTSAGLEGFFRAAGHGRALPNPADWSIGPTTLAPAAAAHGVTLLGPPPSG
jgi:hypothetical protein